MPITDTLTPQWLKDRYLYGIDLTDDTGTDYPDALFEHSIASAIGVVEAELDLVLTDLKTYTERRDVVDSDGMSFFLQSVDHRPLREVVSLKVRLGTFDAMEIPSSWAHVSSQVGGQMQIIPGPADFQGTWASGVPFVGTSGIVGRTYTPLWFEITYKAGYDGVTYSRPPEILDCIGLIAAMLPLDTAGDLLLGAGIASQSVSLDGLSTSTGTTSSATNAGYGARVIQYGKRLDRIIKKIRRKYSVPHVMIL